MSEIIEKSNNTKSATDSMKKAMQRAVRRACFNTEAKAKLNVSAMDAVDTGALMNSIATVLPNQSKYGAAVAKAKKLNPDAEIMPQPEGAKETNDTYTGLVAVGVEYGEYVNDGTVKMQARPFFDQAIAETENELDGIVKSEYKNEVG